MKFRLIPTAALALGLAVISAPAFADPPSKSPAAQHQGKRQHKAGKRGDRPSFPMKAEDYKQMIDKQAARVEARVDKILDKQSATPEVRAQIKKDLAAAKQTLDSLVTKVVADGTVTKDEAKEVRQQAHQLKAAAFAKSGLKAPHRGHGKHHKGGERKAPQKA